MYQRDILFDKSCNDVWAQIEWHRWACHSNTEHESKLCHDHCYFILNKILIVVDGMHSKTPNQTNVQKALHYEMNYTNGSVRIHQGNLHEHVDRGDSLYTMAEQSKFGEFKSTYYMTVSSYPSKV